MRSYVPDFQLSAADNLPLALDLLSQGFRPFAGGTDLMVLFNAGKLPPQPLVNIRKLPELHSIVVNPDFIKIGAAVTYSEIRYHAVIQAEFSLLAQAAAWTGSIANQNRGTLGGNIANASPAADSSPVLLVYDAELTLASKIGERRISYAEFHLGYKSLAMRSDELIVSIRLPRTTAEKFQYGRKVGTRKAMAISKVSFAATSQNGGRGYRIAVGSVAPVPLRCGKTEQFLAKENLSPAVIEQAKLVISNEIVPIDDIRSTGEYRAAVTANLLGDFLGRLL